MLASSKLEIAWTTSTGGSILGNSQASDLLLTNNPKATYLPNPLMIYCLLGRTEFDRRDLKNSPEK